MGSKKSVNPLTSHQQELATLHSNYLSEMNAKVLVRSWKEKKKSVQCKTNVEYSSNHIWLSSYHLFKQEEEQYHNGVHKVHSIAIVCGGKKTALTAMDSN